MNWIELTQEETLTSINEKSFEKPQVIFKHSTRCSISSMVKSRLDRAVPATGIDFYYLDLIAHRTISNKIADAYSVVHESPQVLLIRNGECIYEESYNGITMDEIIQQLG